MYEFIVFICFPLKHIEVISLFCRFYASILHGMESTSISTQVNVKHCPLCQGDTEYYCYSCQQDLCIQCKKLHVIDLSTKEHIVTSYAEKIKYPPKRLKSSQSQDPEHVPLTELRPHKFFPPVLLSPSEHSGYDEFERRQYSDRIYHLRGETIYYRSVLLEGVRHDLKTGHKAVTIRGQSKAEMRGQELKDMIDHVLSGDLKDRCIIQKTRMTRHMIRGYIFYHRYEQLSVTMKIRPIKFFRIMTRKHCPRKDDMKTIIKMLVNQMKGIRLIPSEIPRRAGNELLLTMMSIPVLQKFLSVTGVLRCLHISCVRPDRVWVSDVDSVILTNTETGKNLHSVDDPLGLGGGIHTLNREGELIYIDKNYKVIKLCNDMNTTTTLIKNNTATEWKPGCVYYSLSSGDLLVGLNKRESRNFIGKVKRYDKTGKKKQTIPYNISKPLFKWPCYITENNNRDVVVSDSHLGAVVVTSRKGIPRFNYTGPPSSESRLCPGGICTDVFSNIIVCDIVTSTVQVLDRDGQFLSYVLTRQTPGMDYTPNSLNYDANTHVLWVGSEDNNKISMCQYINRNLHVTGTSHYILLMKD